MDLSYQLNENPDSIIWGPPMIILSIGYGFYLIIRSNFVVFRKFPFILREIVGRVLTRNQHTDHVEEVTSFQALSTALTATVGTGNIVGVVGVILLGGPGAIFWMWIAALVRMATKMAESTLTVAYRSVSDQGVVRGDPMYYISKGLGFKTLARCFAFFSMIATLSTGSTVQSNAISSTLYAAFQVPKLTSALVVTLVTFIVIIGGIKRIGASAEKLVPFVSGLYLLGALFIICTGLRQVPEAFDMIFRGAFQTKAAAGGLGDYTIGLAMRSGTARGVFTNEAGLGSSPIAYAAASTDHPARQGPWGVFKVFVGTLVVCTMTSLVILTTGTWTDHGDASSLAAFSLEEGFPGGKYIVTFGLTLFAMSTILGWEYYGETCCRYFLGDKIGCYYKFIFVPMVFLGGLIRLDAVWTVANSLNGFIAIPNLIGLLGLSGVFIRLQKQFFNDHPSDVYHPDEWHPLVTEKNK